MTRHMRLVSGFAAMGITIGGLVTAAVPAASATGKRSPVQQACHAPAGQPVQVTGRGATGKVKDARPAPAQVIRVDQVGYPVGGSKQAEIMTRSRKGPVHWELIGRSRHGSCALFGGGGATISLGAWSSTYRAVWPVDFSGLHVPGTYRLFLQDHPKVVSPWFRVAKTTALYGKPLANALSFYENERDGPDFVKTKLRTAPAHLNDAHAMTFRAPKVDENGNFKGSLAKYATGVRIDATGGWFDAGDYLHFTETTSYTVAMLLQAIESFPAQVGQHARVSFDNEAMFGLNFLRKMWNERTRTLYLQVGTGEANSTYVADHDIWRLPQADDHYQGSNPKDQYIRHPPVFLAGKPGSLISPNLAGKLAADFALCYRVFSASHPGTANGCLRSAETIYSMASLHWKGPLETVLPEDFYPETSWRDDMMLGGTELALALHDARHLPAGLPVRSAVTYLRDAAHWAATLTTGKAVSYDTLNLYDVSGLADYELYRALGVVPAHGLAITKPKLLANLRAQLTSAAAIGAREPFGYGFAWNQWDTTTHGLGLSVMANEYDSLVGRPVYAAWGQRQLDDLLGANAWGISLIVGDGTAFPDCMQHQVANIAGSDNGSPPILAGAVVEGPNSFSATGWVPNMRSCRTNATGNVPYRAYDGHGAVFADNVQSYDTVEPAIDLTAMSPMAFAWQEVVGRPGF
ncbi:MAG TPA: glycoside hydrolase family 9 protein [Streptosporangiaceae bacterium]|nr:glycoside hydrolase family 9 protein [Streptosporangiaceae bacterium]